MTKTIKTKILHEANQEYSESGSYSFLNILEQTHFQIIPFSIYNIFSFVRPGLLGDFIDAATVDGEKRPYFQPESLTEVLHIGSNDTTSRNLICININFEFLSSDLHMRCFARFGSNCKMLEKREKHLWGSVTKVTGMCS